MKPTTRKLSLHAVAAVLVSCFAAVAAAQDGTDWVTKFPRAPGHVAARAGRKEGGRRVALFVGAFGFGQGPVYRPDLASRSPDLVNENFRQYSLSWGNLRVARLFKDLDVPLSIVLNAEFPRAHPSEWKEFRAVQPSAPIVAHGM